MRSCFVFFFFSTCSAGPIQCVVYVKEDPKNGPTHVITSCNHATNRSLHADLESQERFWRLKMKLAVICSPLSTEHFTLIHPAFSHLQFSQGLAYWNSSCLPAHRSAVIKNKVLLIPRHLSFWSVSYATQQ